MNFTLLPVQRVVILLDSVIVLTSAGQHWEFIHKRPFTR